ncbi:hypothetical protein EVAR_36828_1 [Eumeta japonica]|uniref:Uncharacterized protein n=1 Tax=Eumeta variegata TaxID=151549 RepID=A0A4C1WDZ0_EUMVA|nr:hypothetical protein EVAR_36828_1 [Eumeta japonica]
MLVVECSLKTKVVIGGPNPEEPDTRYGGKGSEEREEESREGKRENILMTPLKALGISKLTAKISSLLSTASFQRCLNKVKRHQLTGHFENCTDYPTVGVESTCGFSGFHPVLSFRQNCTNFTFNLATVGVDVQTDDGESVHSCRIQVFNALVPGPYPVLESPLWLRPSTVWRKHLL